MERLQRQIDTIRFWEDATVLSALVLAVWFIGYNVGRMGAANQELGLRQSGYQDQAGTALKALTSYDENLMNARNSAAKNAIGTGRINAGEKSRTSTW